MGCCTSNLNNYNYKNTKKFIPKITKGKVIKVYDGDTITVASKYYNDVYKFVIRLTVQDTEIETGYIITSEGDSLVTDLDDNLVYA